MKMGNILIRDMLISDIDELSILYYDFWHEKSDTEKMRKEFKKLINNKDYIFLSATTNDVLIGTILGIMCHELYGNCKPFLVMEDFIVHADYRNMGVGKKLLDKLEEVALTRGCSQIQFITDSNRTNAIEFYKKRGYETNKHIGLKKKL